MVSRYLVDKKDMSFRTIKTLPGPLKAIAAAFTVFPLWSLTFANPLEAYLRYASVKPAALIVAAFWLLPLMIVGLTLKRSLLLLPVFVIECGTLLAQAFGAEQAASPFLHAARYIMLACLCGVGVLLMSREMVFPLLQGGGRTWRSHRRVTVNRAATIEAIGDAELKVRAVIENASLGGLLLVTSSESIQDLIRKARPGEVVKFALRLGSSLHRVEAKLIWFDSAGPTTRIGLRSESEGTLSALLDAGSHTQGKDSVGTIWERLWARSQVRVAALMLWGGVIGGTLWVPNCGRQERTLRASVADAPPDESIAITLEWHRPDEETALALTGSPLVIVTSVQGCKSGFAPRVEWQEGAPSTLPVPIGDVGCKVMIIELRKLMTVYTLVGPAFDPALNAINKFSSGTGEVIQVVNVAVLPAKITAGASVAFRVATVSKGESSTINVAIPDEACTIALTAGQTPTASTVQFEVHVHPIYLETVRTLTFFPCGESQQWGDCSTQQSKKAIEYKSFFTKKNSKGGPYMVSATVDIKGGSLRNRVSQEGKSMSCSAYFY